MSDPPAPASMAPARSRPPSWCWPTAPSSRAAASARAGKAVGEVCFNTSMTGYQEILTDPSYAGQIITFTFPHIGNVGANPEDIETIDPGGARLRAREPTSPSRRTTARRQHLDAWLRLAQPRRRIAGVDTRRADPADPRRRRANGVIAHRQDGEFDLAGAARRGRRPGPGSKAWTSPRTSPAARPISWDETRLALGRRLWPSQTAPQLPRRRRRLRRQAQHPALPRRRRLPTSPWCRRRPPPTTSCATSPTASSCRTARAIRRRPATTPCR